MVHAEQNKLTGLRLLLPAALLALLACGDEQHVGTEGNIDPERTPTMLTRDVETFISDSGVTRYKIATPMWLVYDEARQPYWNFPQGLRLVKYDDNMAEDATVEADSARYIKRTQLWRLDGNVRINNQNGDRFLTNQLFWDQRTRKIYSDSFIHIERPDRTLEGYGFTANERLTQYKIHRVMGIFPANALRRDSAAVEP